ncbi:hypothetical protein [Nocardiopsis lambiniae]|uniref:Secreted protein n=1 Tax=Nocardiopsis lambiniae TaxID=3075539 RepID=A0ABU2M7W9_9ACTN|nr:hypothetical protein [Nocardiopsis sp. DSM 44743]MDT0328678.1 hypothetical protein [Nocardiopsis sp. DSM 44743]
MEGALPVLAVVVVVVTAGAVVVSAHFRKERVVELRRWARAHAWTYDEHHPAPLGDTALPRPLGGRSPRFHHVLTGRHRAHEVVFFEHTPRPTAPVARGEAQHTYRIVAVRIPGAGSDLEIRRRDDASTAVPTETAFDRAFQVSGADGFARAALDRETVAWLLSDPRSRSFPVRFSGDHVLTWAVMRLDPDRALTAADYLIDLIARIPARAWRHDDALRAGGTSPRSPGRTLQSGLPQRSKE